MFAGARDTKAGALSRTSVVLLLVLFLVFPPGIFADNITWNGAAGDGSFGNPANWTCTTCGSPTYPNNGNLDLGFDAVIQSSNHANVGVTLDPALEGIGFVNVNSLSIRGGHVSSTANLTVTNGATIVLGTPASTSGNVLTIGDRGSLSINDGGIAGVELSGGGYVGPGLQTSVGAYVGYGGQINVTDGGTLSLGNGLGGNRTFTNNGNISVTGTSTDAPATLQLADEGDGLPVSFTFSGRGTLTLGGTGNISGFDGDETLINDVGHTIAGDGLITDLAGVTNNGTLKASTNGASLIVDSNLNNWNSGTGKLTSGTYSVSDGATLQINSIGAGSSVQTLNLANVSIAGSGLLTGSDGTTNALTGLTNISDSSLKLSGVTGLTITPGGSTLTLGTDNLGVPASMTVGWGSNATVNGGFTNFASAESVPTRSTLNVLGGSTLTAGSFLNQALVGELQPANANATVNVISGSAANSSSTLNVDNLTTSTNNAFTSFLSVSASASSGGGLNPSTDGSDGESVFASGNSTINVKGSAASPAYLNVANNLNQGGAPGSNYSQGNDIINLTNAAATVGVNFANNNGFGLSQVNLNNSTLQVTGAFTQDQTFVGGLSQLNLTNGSIATVGGLTNSSYTSEGTPQSQISITGGSSLTVLGSGNFTNVSGGTLSGGSYLIGNGSSLNYTDTTGDINTLDYNTQLTLDNNGGTAGTTGVINNGQHNALTDSLSTVNGTLTLQNNASLALTQSLTVGGTLTLSGGGNQLSTAGLTNNGTVNIGAGDTVDARTGSGQLGNLTGGTLSNGTYNISGNLLYNTGTDTSTYIQSLSNVAMNLSGAGAILFGSGAGTDALGQLSSLTNGSALTLNGQRQSRTFGTAAGGPGTFAIDSTSSLTLNNSNVTFGDTNLTSGNVLSNSGSLTVNSGGNAILELTSGGTGALNSGQITVNDGGSLTLQNTSGGIRTLTNNGAIAINGSSTAGILQTSDASTGPLEISGTGTLALSGLGQIVAAPGTTLIVDAGQLTNWTNDVNTYSTLSGGAYVVGSDAKLQLSDIGSGNSVQNLTGNATITVSGTGLLTGDGVTNSLTGLTSLTGSTVNLIGVTGLAISPNNSPQLTLNADGNNIAANLNLRQGSSVTVNGALANNSSNVAITNGSSLTLTGNLTNIQDNGSGYGTLSGGSYLIGSGSSLNYTGPDNIGAIDVGTSVTLGNREGLGTGEIANNGTDALKNSLNDVEGTLTLQNGASLALGNAQGSFGVGAGGSVNVLSGSTLTLPTFLNDFDNESNGAITQGNFTIGRSSTIKYDGNDIVGIGSGASLTLDNTGGTSTTTGTLKNMNGVAHDALSASLNTVAGTLTLQNGANLTLAPVGIQAPFTFNNSGTVNIVNGSTLDVSGLGANNFTNVTGAGLLTGGNFLIGTGSFLNYSGADINTIDSNVTLTFDNANNGVTGGFQNLSPTQHDGLSNSLTTNNGNLALQNGASLTLSQAFTNNATVDLDYGGNGGSTLTANGGFTNYNAVTGMAYNSNLVVANGLVNSSDDSNSNNNTGTANLALDGSTASVTGGLTNTANVYNGGSAYSTLSLSSGSSMSVDSLTNSSNEQNSEGASAATVNLAGSSLAVRGNVDNVALTSNGAFNSSSSINVDLGGTLSVHGSFTNDGGANTGFTSLNLTNNSTATICGLLTNTGGAEVDLDGSIENGPYGEGGSILNANGGVTNYNSAVTLNNASTLNVTGGFLNSSDDSMGGEGGATLSIGSVDFSDTSLATITGGLVNAATTTQNGYAEADVYVNAGSTLNVDTLTNSASVNTPYGEDEANAAVSVSGSLNVTGAVNNKTLDPLSFDPGNDGYAGSFGTSAASINLTSGNMHVGGTFTNYNSTVSLTSTSVLNSTAGFLNSADDNNWEEYGAATLSLDASTATVTGGLTNSAIADQDGVGTSTISLADQSSMTVDTLNNTANGSFGSAYAQVNLTGQSSLTVTGNVSNTSSVADPGEFASAWISLDGGSSMTVGGTFNNTGAVLSLTNGSTATVNGLFTNDAASLVSLDGTITEPSPFGGEENTDPPTSPPAGSTLTTNGFSNQGDVELNNLSTLNNTGSFTNSGYVNLYNGSVLTTTEAFDNTNGTLSLNGGTAANTVTANGLTNKFGTLYVAAGDTANFEGGAFTDLDSSGKLKGGNYQIAGLFQFDSSSGFINQIGKYASLTLIGPEWQVQSLTGKTTTDALSTLAGNAGNLTLTDGATLNTTPGSGAFTNTGTVTMSTTAVTAANALNVTGDVFNTSPGTIAMTGTGDQFTASGQFTNSGAINFTGSGATVSSVGDFTNSSTGVISMSGTSDVLSTQGTMNNAGTVTIGDGEGIMVAGGGTYSQTAGTTTIDSGGTLTAALTDITGGVLAGGGTVAGNLTIDGGTLNPGDPQSITDIGNYDQTLLGILDLDLATPQSYDHVEVQDVSGLDLDPTQGNVQLDGTLELNLESGFAASVAVGETFDVMDWTGTENGNFATFIDPTFTDGNGSLDTFQEVLTANQLDLDVIQATATPEPSTLSMLFCAMLLGGGITWKIRRRRGKVVI